MTLATQGDALTGEAPVERYMLRDHVFDRLVDLLLAGTFAPGDSLSIDGLARILGVSPTPVREALVQLEHTGLVKRLALRGYTVSPHLTPDEIGQLIDAREIAELGALDHAMKHHDELRSALEVAHAQHRAVATTFAEGLVPVDETDRIAAYRRYFEADWGFHLAIMHHADNPFLLSMAHNLGSHVHRLRQTVDVGLTDMLEALAEHEAVLRAVQSGDSHAAHQAMLDHLEAVRERSIADSSLPGLSAESTGHPARMPGPPARS